jgi:citrate lyase subunit beta/citryl-CoA lyase
MAVTWLFVPGDRPGRFAKAAASGADVVIVDLEDAVTAEHKPAARDNLVSWLAERPEVAVEVRVNGASTPWHRADLEALRDVGGVRALRVPKVVSPGLLPAADVPLVATVETAVGVEAAYDIARDPRVAWLALGEADLRSDLGVSSEDGLSWVRQRIVVAARAAGLPSPAMSAYPDVIDLAGLAKSCERGRTLGFIGRTAIHPRQVPVIAEAFRPTATELASARELIETYTAGVGDGRGVVVLPDGRMADAAMIGEAKRVIERAIQSP